MRTLILLLMKTTNSNKSNATFGRFFDFCIRKSIFKQANRISGRNGSQRVHSIGHGTVVQLLKECGQGNRSDIAVHQIGYCDRISVFGFNFNLFIYYTKMSCKCFSLVHTAPSPNEQKKVPFSHITASKNVQYLNFT